MAFPMKVHGNGGLNWVYKGRIVTVIKSHAHTNRMYMELFVITTSDSANHRANEFGKMTKRATHNKLFGAFQVNTRDFKGKGDCCGAH